MGLNFSREDDYEFIDEDADFNIPGLKEIPFLQRDHPALKRGFSAADLESVREWECLLAFEKGDEDKELTEADVEEIEQIIDYHQILKRGSNRQDLADEKEAEEKKVVQAGITEAQFYEEEKLRVLRVLRKLKLTVQQCRPLQYQGEGDSEEKKDVDFYFVGITEDRAREWAAETGYELELNPSKAIDYLYMMDESLASATKSEDSDALRVAEYHWKYCYVSFFEGVPPTIYYQYPIRNPADQKNYNYSMFRTRDRLSIILEIVQSDIEEGGAGIYVASLAIKQHPIAEMFPIHNATRLDRIMAQLFDRKMNAFMNFPLEDIRDYFGEYVALYFAFLQFQTQYFAPASIFGLIFYVYSLAMGGGLAPGIGYVALVATIWAMLFPVFWKRREYFWALHWGQARFDEQERNRPEYEGEYQRSAIHGKTEEYFSPNIRMGRQLFSLQVFVGFLIALIVSVVGVMILRVVILTRNPPVPGGAVIIGVVNSMVIIVFNNIYGMIAEELNSWENHRTDTEYENNLILKVFVFRFVNSFAALYYMALVLPFQPSKGTHAIGCTAGHCMQLLGVQVAIIFVTQLTVNNAVELGSIVAGRFFATSASFSDENESERLWVQWKSESYESTFEDFNELLIQYGYASLFFISFPLAPGLAFLSLALEARVDGYKLCRATRRPFPRGADDIGAWQFAQEFMGWAALVTNLLLIILITQDIVFPFTTRIKVFKEFLTGIILFIFMYVTFRILKDIYGAKPHIIQRHIRRQEHIENELETAADLTKAFMARLAVSSEGKDIKGWKRWSVHQVLKFLNETLVLNEKLYPDIAALFTDFNIAGKVWENLTLEQLMEEFQFDNENYAEFIIHSRDLLNETAERYEAEAGAIENIDEAVTVHAGHGVGFDFEELRAMATFFADDLVAYSKQRLWSKVDTNNNGRIEGTEIVNFLYYAIIVFMKAREKHARLPKKDDPSMQAVIVPLSQWLQTNKLTARGLSYEEFDADFPEWLRQYVRQTKEADELGIELELGQVVVDTSSEEWEEKMPDVIEKLQSSQNNVLLQVWGMLDKKNRGSLGSEKYLPRLVYGCIALYCKLNKTEPPKYDDMENWAAEMGDLIKTQLTDPRSITRDEFNESFLAFLQYAVDEKSGRGGTAVTQEKKGGRFGLFGRRG